MSRNARCPSSSVTSGSTVTGSATACMTLPGKIRMTPWRSRSMRNRPSRWQARIRSTRLAKPNLRSSNEASTLRRNCLAWRIYIGQRGRILGRLEQPAHLADAVGDARLGRPAGGRRAAAERRGAAGGGAAATGRRPGDVAGPRDAPRASSARAATPSVELDQHVAAGFLQRDVAGGGELLGEVAEAAGAIGALGEGRIQLQQRALEQPQLRRDLAVRQHLQRPAHERHRLLERGGLRRGRPPGRSGGRDPASGASPTRFS